MTNNGFCWTERWIWLTTNFNNWQKSQKQPAFMSEDNSVTRCTRAAEGADQVQEVDKPGLDSLKTGRWIGGNHHGLPNRAISAISVRFDLPLLRLRYSASSKAAVTATRRCYWTRSWISWSSGNAGKRESGGYYLYQRDFQEYVGTVIIARNRLESECFELSQNYPCQHLFR